MLERPWVAAGLVNGAAANDDLLLSDNEMDDLQRMELALAMTDDDQFPCSTDLFLLLIRDQFVNKKVIIPNFCRFSPSVLTVAK